MGKLTTKLKVTNSLAKQNFVKQLINGGISEIKELEEHLSFKMSPQLTQDIMQFVEMEISKGKFSKADLDKSGIVSEILKQTFGLTDEEIITIENQVSHILDNNLVKKNTFLKQSFTFLKGVLVPRKNYL
jgi:hypothetical protein